MYFSSSCMQEYHLCIYHILFIRTLIYDNKKAKFTHTQSYVDLIIYNFLHTHSYENYLFQHSCKQVYIKTSLYIISSKQIYIKQIVSYHPVCKHIGKQIKTIFLLSHKHTNTSTPFFVHTQKSEQHPREPFAEKSSVSTNETEPSTAAASVSESSVAPLRPRNRPAPCAAKGSLYDFDAAAYRFRPSPARQPSPRWRAMPARRRSSLTPSARHTSRPQPRNRGKTGERSRSTSGLR